MTTIVLVPGFWLGAWAWEEVAHQLRAAGHRVCPVTLTGLADRAAEATPEVDLDTHVDDLVRLIEDNDLTDVLLVAHSGANLPVTGAADRLPERLRRIVYVDSGPMPGGMSYLDFSPPPAQAELRAQVAERGDGWLLPVREWDQDADPVLLAELTEEHLAALRTRSTPQPFGTATQPLDRPARLPATPKAAIVCTFTPDQVTALAASGNPVFSLMAELDVRHLPTGHWPMLSRPKELAALLDELATL